MLLNAISLNQTVDRPDRHLKVGIVGAGSSGIYLASLLAQQGHDVTLFEQSPQPKAEGCGILLISSGMEALFNGNPQICNAILQTAIPARTYEFRNLKDTIVNVYDASESTDDTELPSVLVHRGDILNALLAHFPPDCLRTNAKLQSITQTDTTVTAHFADGNDWTGDVLVGADGIFSTVRDYVQPGVQPNYLGDIVWRGITADNLFCTNGNFKVYIRSRGIYANFFDLGHGQTHWGFFIEKDQAPDEIGHSRPHDIAIPRQELAKLPHAARKIIESTPDNEIKCRFSYDIDPLPQIHQGRIILIGDAAHAKSPSRARGMTAGLEDAIALARHLAANLTVPQMLSAFEAERLPIDHEYQRSSRAISIKTRSQSHEEQQQAA